MAELADALDSGSSEHYAHASSSLVIRITENKDLEIFQILIFLIQSPILVYRSEIRNLYPVFKISIIRKLSGNPR